MPRRNACAVRRVLVRDGIRHARSQKRNSKEDTSVNFSDRDVHGASVLPDLDFILKAAVAKLAFEVLPLELE